ncbi:DUF2226 domain-containing protein [Methanothermococcus sp. SCGC AD-155-C09]|nr:DUF2226 domain-containing protein [Methanothermococcus sp. SCGC AD-155-C09]
MAVQIIEGNLVKIVEEGDVDKIIKELQNFNGYLRMSLKKDGYFEEGYIFLSKGSIIGYWYSYRGEDIFGSRAIDYIENMKNSRPIVEIYEYTDEKLRIMMDLFKEMFIKKETIDKVESENVELTSDDIDPTLESLKYYNITLTIPEGKPLKMDAGENYKEYLKDYRLLEIFGKEEGVFRRGYLVYHDKEPILSACEYGDKVLFNKDACIIIKKLLKDPNVVIDVYEYDIEKVKILIEYYPQMILKKEVESLIDDVEKGDLQGRKQEKKIKENEYTKPLSREELLKKFNIPLPDEEIIDDIVKEAFTPSREELENIKNELIEKINDYLKTHKDIKSYEIYLDVYYEDEYKCKCNIKLKPKRFFGFDIIYRGRSKSSKDDKIIQNIKRNIMDIISDYPLNIDPIINIEVN